MKSKVLFTMVLIGSLLMSAVNVKLYAQDKTRIDILNPEYIKLPKENDNVEITAESTLEDILRKIDYYYASRNFDESIVLCKATLKKADNKQFIAAINFSLSSSYLEKGINAYLENDDDSFYKLSIQHARKTLEVFPDSWQALSNIGAVYFNMGDYKQAILFGKKSLKIEPNNTRLQENLKLYEETIKQNQRMI